MDYSFFLKDLGRVEDSLLAEVVDWADKLDWDVTTTMWNRQRHIGIDGIRFDDYVRHPVIERLIRDPAFADLPADTLINYEVDCLRSGGLIKEHTDTRTIKRFCSLTHRVHVALSGKGVYSFSRSGSSEWTRLLMEQGHVYLFNNYVMHSVCNKELEDRNNLMLNYIDKEWTIKTALYEKYKLDWTW